MYLLNPYMRLILNIYLYISMMEKGYVKVHTGHISLGIKCQSLIVLAFMVHASQKQLVHVIAKDVSGYIIMTYANYESSYM